jgi:peptide/nickel transport system substrate-binding protein
MNKLVAIAMILTFVLLSSAFFAIPIQVHATSPPTIVNPGGFVEDTIQGGQPQTVDYSWAYDTASGQIVQNTMDTLIVFNGEHTDQYLPCVATQWNVTQLTTPVNSGDGIAGLVFENNIAGTGSTPNAWGYYVGNPGATAMYNYRYYFEIRPGILFQPPYNYSLTAADVVYSFQRTMVQDRVSGPQWMIYEPLLDNAATGDQALGGIADLTNPTQVSELGALIRDSVQSGVDAQGNTWVWFNLMYPGPYNGFLQVICQTWSSIESKQWIDNQVIAGALRHDWNGNWPDTTSWNASTEPTISPLDDPTWMEYGSGPFQLQTYITGPTGYWFATRNVDYWGGWPASYPSLGTPAVTPAGFVDNVTVTWAYDWATAYTNFLTGACDFVAVPTRADMPSLYTSPNPPYDPPTNYPSLGIRCIHPLPELEVDACYFTYNIVQGVDTGTILPNGTFSASGIPGDFFGNPTWGIYVRQAFAEAFNYSNFIATQFLGEGFSPATALIPGLNYYNSSILGYPQMYPNGNLAAAKASLDAAVAHGATNLESSGFTITIGYNSGNLARQYAVTLLTNAFAAIGLTYFGSSSRFTVTSVGPIWGTYLTECGAHQLSAFFVGWLADFPDANDFAFPFYDSAGAYGEWQLYKDPAMDAAVTAGALGTTDAVRQAAYNTVQKLAVADCPSFCTVQGIGRHFEQDWVVGWYYNPIYPDEYFYNLWKYDYSPYANNANTANGYNLPADVNYDGKVDIKDVHAAAAAYGAYYGPPTTSNWVYRADVNNDRKVDIKDVHYIAALYGTSLPPGTIIPWQEVRLNATGIVYVDPPVTLLATVTGGSSPYSYEWLYDNAAGETAISGATATTYTVTTAFVHAHGTQIGSTGIYWMSIRVRVTCPSIYAGKSQIISLIG